eukprot:366211-Chlamydomonas_euryale.AAC.1
MYTYEHISTPVHIQAHIHTKLHKPLLRARNPWRSSSPANCAATLAPKPPTAPTAVWLLQPSQPPLCRHPCTRASHYADCCWLPHPSTPSPCRALTSLRRWLAEAEPLLLPPSPLLWRNALIQCSDALLTLTSCPHPPQPSLL